TVADRARGLIATAGDDGRARGEPREGGGIKRNSAAHLARFVAFGKDGAIDVQFIGQFPGPAAADDVEERRAGCVRDIGGELAGEAETNVVLGQKDFAQALIAGWFMVANPEQLGESEAGEDRVGGAFEDARAARLLIHPIDLGLAALIAPDERRPDDFVGRIEHHEAVHLAGKAYATNVCALCAGEREYSADGVY